LQNSVLDIKGTCDNLSAIVFNVPVSTVLEIEQIERIKILKFISEMKMYTYRIVAHSSYCIENDAEK